MNFDLAWFGMLMMEEKSWNKDSACEQQEKKG
jgi:hypothetical protein